MSTTWSSGWTAVRACGIPVVGEADATDDHLHTSLKTLCEMKDGIIEGAKRKQRLHAALYRMATALCAQSDVLSLLGSWGDPLTDEEVLDMLERLYPAPDPE